MRISTTTRTAAAAVAAMLAFAGCSDTTGVRAGGDATTTTAAEAVPPGAHIAGTPTEMPTSVSHPGELPPGWPEFLELPADARSLSGTEASLAGAESLSVTFYTAGTADSVVTAYATTLLAAGFSAGLESSTPEAELRSAMFSSDTAEVSVVAAPDPGAEPGEVLITLSVTTAP